MTTTNKHNLPRRAKMLCGNCHINYWIYLARKESVPNNAQCPRCLMYAANKIYDYPIAVLDLQHAIKFNPVTAETTECPSVLGFPVDFGDCSDCKMFVDCIGFDVFCKIQLEKNTSKLIEAKNNGK